MEPESPWRRLLKDMGEGGGVKYTIAPDGRAGVQKRPIIVTRSPYIH